MRLKRPLFAIVTVLLLFAILEVVLWAAGVPTLMSEQDPFRGFSDVVQVYQADEARGIYHTHPRAVAHSLNYQEFMLEKPNNGFRLFILGGSSAYGFPWGHREAFSRLLGDALQASWPERTIEAVNSGAMSYGSHRLRILTRELLQYEPDALVIYGGHNEFVESRFYSDVLHRYREVDRARALLYRWRLYSAMTRLYDKRPQTSGDLLGLDVVREYSDNIARAERIEVRERFEENLQAIIDLAEADGTAVVLCTVPSNLSGWVPNQSTFGDAVDLDERRSVHDLVRRAGAALADGDAGSAAADLERARSLAPDHAETNFLLGRAYEALGRWHKARQAYIHARDTDGKPSRAVSAFNDTIRQVADERSILLVDLEKVFEEVSPNGLTGFDLLEDYVHPKPAAHRLIAIELWKAFMENGLLGERRAAVAFPVELAVSPGADTPTAALLYNLAVVLENQGHLEQAMEKYRACIELDPRHKVAHYNLGRLLAQDRKFSEAVVAYGKALEIDPADMNALINLGEAFRHMGRLDQAHQTFLRASRLDPRSAPAWNRLGVVLSQSGRQAESETALRHAVELEPRDAVFHVDLGFSLLFQGKIDQAEAAFTHSRSLDPENVRGLNGLAAVMTERGQLDRAEMLFRETLKIDPEDPYAAGGLQVIEQRRASQRPALMP